VIISSRYIRWFGVSIRTLQGGVWDESGGIVIVPVGRIELPPMNTDNTKSKYDAAGRVQVST